MSERIALRDPRTGAPDGAIEVPTGAELDPVVAALRAAQPAWAAAGVDGRAAALTAWRGRLLAHREQVVAALVADTGRRAESELEVDICAGAIERWSVLAPELLAEEGRRGTSVPGIALEQHHDPYPLLGVISPWNFPLLLALIDTIPALLAGCAVLVKPSEVTPRFAAALAPTLGELGEVLRVIPGGAGTGRALLDRVDAVCFTGSVPTGEQVAARAAERMIPASLELGGKDPAIVLPGADLERAAAAILWGGTANAGQSCQSIERVYVVEPLHDQFVELLVERAAAVGLACEGEPGLGPIIAARQVETIARHLADARERGATVRTGGEIEEHGGGSWLRPTVLSEVDHGMTVMTEETFGPVLPVMAVRDVEHAVELANATRYGLSAAVFGPERDALEVASRIEAGAVSVNDASLTAVVHEGEKHAYKRSGLGGTRMGAGSLRRFLRRRATLVKTDAAPDPWWWPEQGSE